MRNNHPIGFFLPMHSTKRLWSSIFAVEVKKEAANMINQE